MSSKKLKLSKTISRDGKEIKEIEFREITVHDLEKAANEDNNVTRQIVHISALSGLSGDEVRGLAMKDYIKASEIVNENLS